MDVSEWSQTRVWIEGGVGKGSRSLRTGVFIECQTAGVGKLTDVIDVNRISPEKFIVNIIC